MRSCLAVGFVVLGASVASGQEISVCRSLEDDGARLACFDKLVEGVPATPPMATDFGKWRVVEKTSPLDDSKGVAAALLPQSSSSTGFTEASAYIRIGCDENVTSVVISTEMFMRDERPSVTYRIGNAKAVTEAWPRSTDYKAVGLWSGKEAIPFIKALADGHKLVVRLQDRDRVDAEFDLSNVSAVRSKVAAACGWK